MLKYICSKNFANGSVYALQTKDGFPIETTDTFLPFYTKDAVSKHTNKLLELEKEQNYGSRSERWMIGVSVCSGCCVGCLFCAAGQLNKYRVLTTEEIVAQVEFIISKNKEKFENAQEHKINYTRLGDTFLNLKNVQKAIEIIDQKYPNTHHFISTIGIKNSDFSWIKDNITLQISLHSLDEERRNKLIPFPYKMTIEELGKIRTKSNLKTTVNLTLVDNADFDIVKLQKYFDPKHFFIKLSPINENTTSQSNNMGTGIIQTITQ